MAKEERFEVRCTVTELDELSAGDRELVQRAGQAALGAYARYSHFRVGAALRLHSGEIVAGSNQENASFPAGICAERTALHAAMAAHPQGLVEAMAIVVPDAPQGRPVSPCGICRQALAEQESRQHGPVRLIMAAQNGPIHVLERAGDLLPWSFDASFLKS
ncbi:MAG: cytidine deaminase [Flavobacteriales bacterium]|nr:cytidine deaminase [Flavobacteriales bacterium]